MPPLAIGGTMEYSEAVVIHDKPIKPYGNTAHVYVPKRFIGKRATIIIYCNEKDRKNLKNNFEVKL
ncbi:DUF2080 family transposase-associated protein [Methanocaldococcus sp.]|uniref:DUF2080 family transposase-associated protein n=1 Tax=Methanocaldococcus sp. TaxID=2152917 RepID=UPI002625AABA|nr:DUF2080 family transposase-associated protein [Methanocaldococcus sp.]